VVRRVRYHRTHHSTGDAPLCRYYTPGGQTKHVMSAQVTTALRTALATMNHADTGIRASEVDARSLRAGGATALLCAGVDTNIIQLLGRWQSDAMIRYLHVSAAPVMRQYASRMLSAGTYSFTPGTAAPALPL
jgi:hypothetical protein